MPITNTQDWVGAVERRLSMIERALRTKGGPAPAPEPHSVAPVADTLVMRTSDARAKAANPTESNDLTTKSYVDAIGSSLSLVEADVVALQADNLLMPRAVAPSSVTVGSGSASVDAATKLITFTGCSSIALDGLFAGNPGEAYQIFISSTGSAANYQFIRTRAGGVTRTTAGYNRVGIITANASGPARSSQFGDTVLCYLFPSTAAAPSINAQLVWHTPNITGRLSQVRVHSISAASDRFMWDEYGQGDKGDGFILACTAGTATGTIRVVKMV